METQRQIFMDQLREWSLRHDSSLYFNGYIEVQRYQKEPPALGCSVSCKLARTTTEPYRVIHEIKPIIIRLFAPRNGGNYRLVVRSGSSWVPAREYFDRQYFSFTHQNYELSTTMYRNLSVVTRSTGTTDTMAPKPDPDRVTIQPFFHKFLDLPMELQFLIMEFGLGKTTHFYPGKDKGPGFAEYMKYQAGGQPFLTTCSSVTKLSSMLSISKSLNSYVSPWVYRSINFTFGCQGLTNFLWLVGPRNRMLIKNMTLTLGALALPHCMRWMSPDPVYSLFLPDSYTDPTSMQLFWRCAIQDLAQELHLNVLTIGVESIPIDDMPFVVGSLQAFFGGIMSIRYTRNGIALDAHDEALSKMDPTKTWGQICKDAFIRYLNNKMRNSPLGKDRRLGSLESLEDDMLAGPEAEFFTSAIGGHCTGSRRQVARLPSATEEVIEP